MPAGRDTPGNGDHGTAVWASEAWRKRATSWLDAQLAAAGIARTGEVEQTHLRPWATVLKAPTSAGAVWFKASARTTAFEAGLYELLAHVAPAHVLMPLGVDAARGWILLPDGGATLGERASGEELVDALALALPRYGQLQRELAPQADALLALGVSDMRPERMPARFDEALEAVRTYVERAGGAADRARIERVAELRDTVTSWCDRLASAPAAASLDHNDLHPWNILVDEDLAVDRARFYDWGDSVVAHPFASMLALGFVPMDAADIRRLRDAYLEVFSDLASHAELVEALELACRVGKIARALTWHRAISAAGWEEVDDDWVTGPIESLVSLLENSYLGRA